MADRLRAYRPPDRPWPTKTITVSPATQNEDGHDSDEDPVDDEPSASMDEEEVIADIEYYEDDDIVHDDMADDDDDDDAAATTNNTSADQDNHDARPSRRAPLPEQPFDPDYRAPQSPTRHWPGFPLIRVRFVLREQEAEAPAITPASLTSSSSSSSATTTTTTTTTTTAPSSPSSRVPPHTSTLPAAAATTTSSSPARRRTHAVLSKLYQATMPYQTQAHWSLSDVCDLPALLRLVAAETRCSVRHRVDVWHLDSLQLLDADCDVKGVLEAVAPTAAAAVAAAAAAAAGNEEGEGEEEEEEEEGQGVQRLHMPGFAIWVRERAEERAGMVAGREEFEGEGWDEVDWAERESWRSLVGRVVYTEEEVPGEEAAMEKLEDEAGREGSWDG